MDKELNVCRMEPPQPMELALEALSVLAQEDRLVLIIDREPVPFYRVLERNGYRHKTESGSDGIYRITIWSNQAQGS